jgi:uncharacterized protein Smg (DUF494 family)
MKEKVVEILMYLMSEIQENKQLAEIDLTDLRERGYTHSEISAAFSWLLETFQVKRGGFVQSAQRRTGSRRVLHEAERIALSTDSQGYLIQMMELGLLDDRDVETVIERAMLTGFEKISTAELREIVASVLFSKGRPGIGPGSLMIDSGDTVH